MNIPLQKYGRLLSDYLRPQRLRVLSLLLLLLGGIGLQIVNPQILRHFIDAARQGEAQSDLMLVALVFIGAAVITQILAVASRYFSEKVGWAATNALRQDLALHCLRLDMSFHNKRTPGEMIERIDGDVATLAEFFSQMVVHILGNVLLLVGILAALYLEDWRIGAAMSIYAVVCLVVLGTMRNIAVPYWKKAREASADLFGFLEEQLSSTEDTRANGGVAHAMRRLYGFTTARLERERRAGVASIWLRIAMTLLYTLGHSVALILGYYLFNEGSITIGTVFMINHYTNNLFRPLMTITRQMEDLQKAGAGVGRIDELRQTQSLIKDGPGFVLPAGPIAVDFERVTFGYNVEEPVLRDVSFKLESGKILGLLGRTGSGKTTLTRLIFRLYELDSGTIRLGGHDLRQASLEQVRSQIGMVTQSVQLFKATVRDNLTFFDSAIDDRRIMEVLDDLGLMAWYEKLPQGLETQLDSGGGGLSAGEAQLLTFTRVFLRDPRLVILDEASSRLDPVTEQLIERAVDRLLQGRSAIIIAHRLGTVQRADDIMVLEGGGVLEYGPRAGLAADPQSRFSHLLRTGMTEVLA
jgi:ATP-binding cassette, subfamily B, bacterial